jgi:hypothetical protein
VTRPRISEDRRADAERDVSAAVTAILRADEEGLRAVLGNGDWRVMAETGAAWLAELISGATAGACPACAEEARRIVLGSLRRLAGPEPPGAGADGSLRTRLCGGGGR